MKRTQRIGYNRYYDDKVFEKHLEFVKKNIDVIDELWLFAEFSHYGYWPLEESKKTAEIIKKRIKAYKAVGVKSVGINILCTIGHMEEGWDVLPKAPLQYTTGRDGEVSTSCLCPSGDDYLEYVSNRYKIFAQAEPDFIYMDDDIRVLFHGIADVCYCENCITLFNREYGHCYGRKGLVNEIDNNVEIANEWDNFRNNTITKITATVEKAVHTVNPNIKIGLMTAVDSDSRVTKWMETGKCVMGRPGSGFYTDDKPLDFLQKCYKIEKQISVYPDAVTDIQYEFECFRYITLDKSMCMSALECSAAMFLGCNGIAFNAMVMDDKPVLTEMIRENTPVWEQILKTCNNTTSQGIYCASPESAFYIQKIGIPVTPLTENACAYIIIGNEWDLFDDKEILKMLSGAVLTDGDGFKWLSENGYSDYIGAKLNSSYTNGMAQRFTCHGINGDYKNYYRDVFMTAYYGLKCYDFAVDEGAEILANIETTTHIVGAPTMYVYKNSLGGCISVDGYLQPQYLNSEAKRTQLYNLFRYMTGNQVPVLVNDYKKIVTFARKDKKGHSVIMLINASFDETGEFTVQTSLEGEVIMLDTGRKKLQNTNGTIAIPNIKPWHAVVITNKLD